MLEITRDVLGNRPAAHRFAGGPAPVKPPKTGPRAYRNEIRGFVKWLCAAAIALVTIGVNLTVDWLLAGHTTVQGDNR